MRKMDRAQDKRKVPLATILLSLLQSIAPEEITPKLAAFQLGVSLEAVRKQLQRLFHRGKIIRSSYGWYRATHTMGSLLRLEDPEIRLHGLKLEGTVPKGEGASALMSIITQNAKPSSGNRLKTDWTWEGRSINIQVSKSGKLEISMKSSENPLDYVDFEKFISWMDGRFENRLHLLKLHLVQIGINRDFTKVRLNGVQTIFLGQFRNAWGQIYYKRKLGVTRVELHIQPNLGLADALNILQGMEHPCKEPSLPSGPQKPGPGPDKDPSVG